MVYSQRTKSKNIGKKTCHTQHWITTASFKVTFCGWYSTDSRRGLTSTSETPLETSADFDRGINYYEWNLRKLKFQNVNASRLKRPSMVGRVFWQRTNFLFLLSTFIVAQLTVSVEETYVDSNRWANYVRSNSKGKPVHTRVEMSICPIVHTAETQLDLRQKIRKDVPHT